MKIESVETIRELIQTMRDLEHVIDCTAGRPDVAELRWCRTALQGILDTEERAES